MTIKYLLDENVDPVYRQQFLLKAPNFTMWSIGDPGVPPKGTLDPEILVWCEDNQFILVTNNRKSMPVHLADHLAEGRHIPGILILGADLSVGENLKELILIAKAAFDDEYCDQIVNLPLSLKR